MIIVSGMKIQVTRGDCAPFTITLTGTDVPPDGEDVLFSVKMNAGRREPVIEKTVKIEDGALEIAIRNADTKNLEFGKYEWDIRFPNFHGAGEPFTPMLPQPFEIVKVIGNV